MKVETLYLLAEESTQYAALRADCDVSVLLPLVLPFTMFFIRRGESNSARKEKLKLKRQRNKKEMTCPRLTS